MDNHYPAFHLVAKKTDYTICLKNNIQIIKPRKQ